MNVQTRQFVKASELFNGLESLFKLFADSEPKCSWGDNCNSLVKPSFIVEHLKSIEGVNQEQLNELEYRIWTIPQWALVDLEIDCPEKEED